MPANIYSWEATGSSSKVAYVDPNRKLKMWLVIAAAVSILAHALLWMIFQMTTLTTDKALATEMMQKTRTFKIDRVMITESPVIDERSRDDAELAEILNTDATPLVKEIDENDPNIYEKLPEHQVRLTQTEKMSEFEMSQRPSIRGENTELTDSLEPLDHFSMQELEEEVEAMTSRVLPMAKQASPDQIVIEIEDADPGFLNGKDLDAFNNALAKAAGNAEVTQGFSNLDDLLNRTGPLLDDTKPILIPTDLLFKFNEAELQESARLSMMKLGLLIKRNKDSRFVIEGHTDSIGSEEYNMKLSIERAESVRDWLIESLGLTAEQLSVKGFGETKLLVPAVPSKELAVVKEAINRRVEIAIKPVKK